MARAVVLEAFVLIVRDVFCAVPTFSFQDIGNSKSQFLHLPLSLGGAMLNLFVQIGIQQNLVTFCRHRLQHSLYHVTHVAHS